MFSALAEDVKIGSCPFATLFSSGVNLNCWFDCMPIESIVAGDKGDEF